MTPPDPTPPVTPVEHRRTTAHPARLAVVLAFAAICLIWGTTFLGIRYAVETIPPFLMGATRFLLAGGLLFAWTRLRGVPPPRRALWKPAFVAGFFMMLVAQGGLSWAEQRVPSGVAAVIVAMMPIWFLLLEWLAISRRRPHPVTVLGIVVGFAGVVILIAPWQTGARDIDLVGGLVVLVGSLGWAVGSLYSRTAEVPKSHLQATAMQMLAGGALLLVAATVLGDWGRFDPGAVSSRSLVALLYLSLVGSLVTLTAYTWLLTVVSSARVSTYAYVNPVVAVLLGTLVAGEALTPRMMFAMPLIVGAVVVTTLAGPAGDYFSHPREPRRPEARRGQERGRCRLIADVIWFSGSADDRRHLLLQEVSFLEEVGEADSGAPTVILAHRCQSVAPVRLRPRATRQSRP